MAQRISPREAQALMQDGWTYVDVRSTQEFQGGHPAGAVSVPLAEMGPMGMQPNPRFLEEIQRRFRPDQKLVLGCEAGGRSARAAMLLESQGYTQLADQRAGWGGARGPGGVVEKGWRDEGLPAETGPGREG